MKNLTFHFPNRIFAVIIVLCSIGVSNAMAQSQVYISEKWTGSGA